jgi:hypothetical protein
MEGRLEHDPAKREFARREASARVVAVGRDFGVDEEEKVDVGARGMRFVRLAATGGAGEDGADELGTARGFFAEPRLGGESCFSGGDHVR